jgi:hypothetical protein
VARRSCNFRTFLGPRGRGRGLGTEATRLIVGYRFEQAHLHRISLHVYTFNVRARRVYEKAGFVTEGVERETLLHENRWSDSNIPGRLEPRCRGEPHRDLAALAPRRARSTHVAVRCDPYVLLRSLCLIGFGGYRPGEAEGRPGEQATI